MANLLTEDLERALTHLPDESRMMLVLAYVEDWSYGEIAQVMDCPIGTVMSSLWRARQGLRSAVNNEMKQSGTPTRRDPRDLEADPLSA